MKKIFYLLIVAICLPVFCNAQHFKINNFYRAKKWKKNTVNFAIPGFAIKIGAKIARKHVEEESVKEALKLAKGIRGLKVMVMEDNHGVSKTSYRRLSGKVAKGSFERLITVQSGEENIDIFIREKKDKIRNLLILVHTEDEFVFLSLKTKLKLEEISKVIKTFIKENKALEKLNIPIPQV